MPAAFVVFEDAEDVLQPVRVEVNSTSNAVGRILQPKSTAAMGSDSLHGSLFHPDKENMDPVTGTHVSVQPPKSLKRKSTPLAPASSPEMLMKSSSAIQARKAKKPKSSSSSTRAPSKRKLTDKRPLKRPTVSPLVTLPNILEDPESSPEKQHVINGRCYDLTVSPLADITVMFDTVCTIGDVNSDEERLERPLVDTSHAPLLEDFPLSGPTRSTRLPKMMTTGLSTPERQRLTADFTFHSPTASQNSA